MRAGWSDAYVGIPFLDGGRTRAGVDCWGLVRIVYEEEFGIALPLYDEGYEDTLDSASIEEIFDEERAAWAPVQVPRPGDAVMLRILSYPCHVGVVVDRRFFLHTMGVRDTCLQKLSAPEWQPRILAFYRHRSMLLPTRAPSGPAPAGSSRPPPI